MVKVTVASISLFYLVAILVLISICHGESLQKNSFSLLGNEDSEARKMGEEIKKKAKAQEISELANENFKAMNEATGSNFQVPENNDGALQ